MILCQRRPCLGGLRLKRPEWFVAAAVHSTEEGKAATVVCCVLVVLVVPGGVEARLPQAQSLRQARAHGPKRGVAAGKPPSPTPHQALSQCREATPPVGAPEAAA